eukprot:jgi/Undpi1/12383/HiC_scaffold_5.g02055.m1
MSALCTVLVMDQPEVVGDALPSSETHLRMRFRRGLEVSSDEGTTPEASTDSDNDSAFESDNDMAGSKRGPPPPPTAIPLGKAHGNVQQQQQRKQPLPRRVRFKLDDTAADQKTSGCDEYVQLWGRERQTTAIQESALRSLGMMGRPSSPGRTPRVHGKRRSFGEAAAATGKSVIFTTPATTIPFSPKSSYRAKKASAQKAAWNSRTVVLPFGRSYENAYNNAINTYANNISACTSANTIANANVNVKAILRNSTPSSPKKRRMLPASSMLRLRARGGGGGGGGRDKNKRRTSPLRGVGNLSELFKAAAAVSSPGSGSKSVSGSGGVSTPGSVKTSSPPLARAEPVPELLCEESLDVEAAMKPKGQVRTPICRLLVPCWPEGVEGYEEAGGWRRLGGVTTSLTVPQGRR